MRSESRWFRPVIRGGILERVNYFAGQLLSEDDFRTEQEYFRGQIRQHNRYLHGWGVVHGLGVHIEEPDTVRIEPGVAIDCLGNLIELCESVTLAIPESPNTAFVTLDLVETPENPVVAGSPDDPGGEVSRFTRIREEARVGLSVDNPASRHRRIGPGTHGCGQPHALCIARIRKGRKRWRVDLRGRRA